MAEKTQCDVWLGTLTDAQLDDHSQSSLANEAWSRGAFIAYNQAIGDVKTVIRGETVDDPYAAPTFINAIARKCSPHVYVNRLSPASAAPVVDKEAEKEFLEASVAVWREIDRLSSLPEGYKGLPPDTDPRIRERAAWERYRSILDATAVTFPPVNRSLYSELVNVAAELVRGDGFLSTCPEDMNPKLKRADLLKTAEGQERRLKDWAYRVRLVANKLSAAATAAPVEQQTFKNTKEAMLYAQRNNIPAVVPVGAAKECRWGLLPTGIAGTSCGDAFEFDEGTPASNNFRFCPFCGLSISTLVFNDGGLWKRAKERGFQ